MSNPSKQPRVDGHPDKEASDAGVIQDQAASFADGNIDIIAGNTSFRVHHGVLSVHSEVFRNMLTMPQRDESIASDGCPRVEVTDSVDDMRHLLLVLYHRHPHFRPGGTVEFSIISSLIRLAHKYQVTQVQTEAVGYLKPLYPDDAHQFINSLLQRDLKATLKHASTDCIEVIDLARLIGDPSLLPAAFYRCCQLPPSVLLGKLPAEAQLPPRRLSDKDLERCMMGERHLAQATVYIRREALKDIAIDCTGGACLEALDYISSTMDATDGPWGLLSSRSPCNAFTRMDDFMVWSDMGLCTECGYAVNGREWEAQERTWNFLPAYFSLKT